MSDYISRDELIEKIRYEGIYGSGYSDKEREDDVVDMIESIPAANVKPVVRGEWCGNGLPGSMLYGCSECGFTCGTYAYFFNYCPNCGSYNGDINNVDE